MADRKAIGYLGQQFALSFLLQKGYHFVSKNWTVRGGELDLIMRYQKMLVFVEVKTQSTDTFGEGLERLSERQFRTLQRTALRYIHKYDIEEKWRIDLVVVHVKSGNSVIHVDHFEALE